MGFNMPDGCTDNMLDRETDFPQEYDKCDICGGDMLPVDDNLDERFECGMCGARDDLVNVPACGMCGSRGLTIKHGDRGCRAECECGCCSPFRETAAEAFDDWQIMN